MLEPNNFFLMQVLQIGFVFPPKFGGNILSRAPKGMKIR